MQMEMEKGGKLFFDLFVAMCNHMVSDNFLYSFSDGYKLTGVVQDDLAASGTKPSMVE
jgi:hypothetical protein